MNAIDTASAPSPAAAEAGSATAAAGATLIVVNPKARSGETDLQDALAALEGAGPAPVVMTLERSADEPERIAAAVASGVRRVVAAGGDGTVSSLLPAVLAARVPLGVIPLGTANDFARTLGLPGDPAAATAVIAAGRTRRVDVGVVNGKHFLNAAGVGFSTELHDELGTRLKGWLGPLAYPLNVLRRWRRHRPFTVILSLDGRTHRCKAMQVTIANGRYYGGGMTAHADARIDDGELDVLVMLPRPLWRYALAALGFRRGEYRNAPVVAWRARELELRTRRPRPMATDGETTTFTPASFSVERQALEVYATDGAAEG